VIFALNTNPCVQLLRSRDTGVLTHYQATNPSTILIPSMVAGELLVGAEKSSRINAKADVNSFLARHTIVPFGETEMREYARVRAQLEQAGMKIGSEDLIIVATALAQGATLVTHNTREFSRVAGLRLVDWQV
jgi:tRNA(fMet)-specific endonuclease VapC